MCFPNLPETFAKMGKDFSSEIRFQTARSGGAGGQHVNKVETMVTGFWQPASSAFFTETEKQVLLEKLANRINREGALLVKSQLHRSQQANKEEVIRSMHKLVQQALTPKKARIATRPTKASQEKRRENKQRQSRRKELRKRVQWNES